MVVRKLSSPCSPLFDLMEGLFPFRKWSLPFLAVDAAIGIQAFSHDRYKILPGLLRYNKGSNAFLNSLRENDVEGQVEFMLKVMQRVPCH